MEAWDVFRCIRIVVFFLFLGIPELLNVLRLLWKFKSFINHIFPFQFISVPNRDAIRYSSAHNQRVHIESLFDKTDDPELITIQLNSACPPLFRSYSSPCISQRLKMQNIETMQNMQNIQNMYQRESSLIAEREQSSHSPEHINNVSPLSIGISVFEQPWAKTIPREDSSSVSPDDMSDVSPLSLRLSIFGNDSSRDKKEEVPKQFPADMRIETLHNAAQCLQNLLDLQIEMFGEVRKENRVRGCELEQLSEKMNIVTQEVNNFREILSDTRNDLLRSRQEKEQNQVKTREVIEKPKQRIENNKYNWCDKDLTKSSHHTSYQV